MKDFEIIYEIRCIVSYAEYNEICIWLEQNFDKQCETDVFNIEINGDVTLVIRFFTPEAAALFKLKYHV